MQTEELKHCTEQHTSDVTKCYTERPSDETQQLYRINGLSRYRCYIYHYNLLVILPSKYSLPQGTSSEICPALRK